MNFALLQHHLRLAAVGIICLTLMACAHRGGAPRLAAPGPKVPALVKPPADLGDGPPLEAYDLSSVVEPTPKNEALARYGNHSPYTVLGKTYRLLPSRSGYVERGVASWYGRKFHGQLTSTREPYDMLALTAAHKTLPLPSYARVTNLANGTSLIVRINDRGPFKDNRIIDLSYAAAVKLGVKQTGTALVEVRVIVPGENPDVGAPRAVAAPLRAGLPPVAPADSSVAAIREPSIYLQVGAFSSRENAELLKRRLLGGSVFPTFVDQLDSANGPIHRVRVGPLETVELADELTHDIEALGLSAPQLVIQ